MSKIIVGNWKMYPTLSDALVLAATLKKSLDELTGLEVVIAPPTPWLVPIHEAWKHRPKHLHLAAQNIWPADQGAFTGEVSAYLLKDIVTHVLIGHSERRRLGEDNDLVQDKTQAALKWHLTPIVCIGENKRVFLADGTVDSYQWTRIADELMAALEGITKSQLNKVVIAYEPNWAIGNSRPATHQYAFKMIDRLRTKVADKYGPGAANELRFLYGGSVAPGNASDYLRYPDIAGLLVGSESVKATDFLKICQQASKLG